MAKVPKELRELEENQLFQQTVRSTVPVTVGKKMPNQPEKKNGFENP